MSLTQSPPETIARKLEGEWRQLCQSHLPIRPAGSMWWYNRKGNRADPCQGWKLHVSATILSACAIFRSIFPCLLRHRVMFKAPRSLKDLQQLNAGVFYGFHQVGKFVTIYPPSTGAAVELAEELDRLTAHQPAPVIPYDEPLRPGSCVYYRYGQFQFAQKRNGGTKSTLTIVRPDGRLVPDRREPGAAVPRWLADPFQRKAPAPAPAKLTKLETSFGDFEALVQRGRGGLYRALDFSTMPAKTCIIKEGRRHGETDWLGRDGFDRIKREMEFLKKVSPLVHAAPRVIRTFRANHGYYLVMEHIPGKSLQAVITSRERISARRTLRYCLQMARILADLHSAGWAWRDCKPANFLCRPNHELLAVDFESACRMNQPDSLWIETPGYFAPRRTVANPEADDLYALGASIAQLVLRTAQPPAPGVFLKSKTSQPGLPTTFVQVTKSLLELEPCRRPGARVVALMLERICE
ncbi:MAG: lipopolysaccharide kinase InaA family protein [Verrucomicrobiota bacterium]